MSRSCAPHRSHGDRTLLALRRPHPHRCRSLRPLSLRLLTSCKPLEWPVIPDTFEPYWQPSSVPLRDQRKCARSATPDMVMLIFCQIFALVLTRRQTFKRPARLSASITSAKSSEPSCMWSRSACPLSLARLLPCTQAARLCRMHPRVVTCLTTADLLRTSSAVLSWCTILCRTPTTRTRRCEIRTSSSI